MKLLLFATLGLAVSSSPATDWPRYRGVNGSGVSTDGEIPTKWTEETTLWNIDLEGNGHGSPVIYGDKLFLLTAIDEKPPAEEAKGKGGAKKKKGATPFLWRALCLNKKSFNSAASSTAAVDAKRVIFCRGTPDLLTMISLSHEGEVQWQKDLGPVVGGHGFGASPILYKDLVVLNNDQENKAAIFSHSTPIPVRSHGKSNDAVSEFPILYPVSTRQKAMAKSSSLPTGNTDSPQSIQ